MPARIADRLRGSDGEIDQQRLSELRERFCDGDEARGERFAAMRDAICVDPLNAENLPPPMLERLRREDGTFDPELLARMRDRICAMNGEERRSGAPPRGQQMRGGGPSPMGFRGDGRGRYFVNLNHSIELENTILIREGGPFLDLLAGDGASGFGLSQHTSSLEAGFFRNGKGIRISGRYTGPSRIATGLIPGEETLRFGSLARLDLRVFADMGRLLKQESGLFDGLRLSLLVDNVFDGRRTVTDSEGNTPLAYQPFLVDPTGRYLGIDIRKMF